MSSRRPSLSLALLLFAAAARTQALTVTLAPVAAAPSPVGSTVEWVAAASGNSQDLLYRFRIRPAGRDFQVVRDFSPEPTLAWTPVPHEGAYDVEVTVRERKTGASAVATTSHQTTSLAANGPVITPTQNPLVFLYSAPPCPAPGRIWVELQGPDGSVQRTPPETCRLGLSVNLYLAGMRANSTYTARHVIEMKRSRQGPTPALIEGPAMLLTTGSVPIQLPLSTIAPSPLTAPADHVLLYSNLFGPPFATDPEGNVIWYYPSPFTLLTRPESGGRFLTIVAREPTAGFGEILREIDVAGNALRETDTARINEQLAAMNRRTIGLFHHDAIALPDGGVAVLATTEQIMNGVQGDGPVDIIGDMVLVLDRDFQVAWTWDAFDHLDPHRQATLHETCPGLGCPPTRLAPQAHDWLHGNALELAADGNLLYSSRHQDWIVKIDFRGGRGSGDVIWRLGKDGDFTTDAADPSPWFSHQHGPRISPRDGSLLAVFDDSNLRRSVDPEAHSRGQVWRLDEQNKVATLALNADLGGFSFAVGNAQPLRNGGYLFDVGWLPDNSCHVVMTDSSGSPLQSVRVNGPQFRAFWMRDLYSGDADWGLPPGRGSRPR